MSKANDTVDSFTLHAGQHRRVSEAFLYDLGMGAGSE